MKTEYARPTHLVSKTITSYGVPSFYTNEYLQSEMDEMFTQEEQLALCRGQKVTHGNTTHVSSTALAFAALGVE